MACDERASMLVREEIIVVYSSSCTCNDFGSCRIVGGCSCYISAWRKNECYCSAILFI